MSSLCEAAFDILALNAGDIGNLYSSSAIPVRQIDIQLDCNWVSSDSGSRNHTLEVKHWKCGTTALCGYCSFCRLLADSIRRSVDSDLWDGWNLTHRCDHASMPRVEWHILICFRTLEYQLQLYPKPSPRERCHNITILEDMFSQILLGGYFTFLGTGSNTGKSKKVEIDIAFELFGQANDPLAGLLNIHRRPLHRPRLSDENVAKLRHWIKECDENHEICFPALKGVVSTDTKEAIAFLPRRLIEVGGTVESKHPRLIFTSEPKSRFLKGQATKYVALSYCWGKVDGSTKLLTTTHETMPSRTEKIEMDTMPQAFQDAIILARILEVEYLWIDSLCIIQDDAQDWQVESSKMADVYSNAYLTLVAATGSGCDDSFLNTDPSGPTCTISLTVSHEGQTIQGEFSLRFRPHRGPSDKMTELRGGKWITRGWTFQEERLSRRSLFFGKNKFFLDCRTIERAQDTALRMRRPEWISSVTENLHRDREQVSESELGRSWNHWQELCTHYTFRELTFPEDRLSAISGMAIKIQKKVKSDYLAGLWKKNLLHDLLWETLTSPTESKRYPRPFKPEKYCAPTWSWASLIGRIHWPSPLSWSAVDEPSIYCTILDAQTTVPGLNSCGAVEDGFLKVRGVFENVVVSRIVDSKPLVSWRLHHRERDIGNASIDIGGDNMQTHDKEFIYQALLMIGSNVTIETNTLIRGLLLQSKGRKREGYDVFERVGTFTISKSCGLSQRGWPGIWDRDMEQVLIII